MTLVVDDLPVNHERQVMARVLQPLDITDSNRREIELADTYIDDALDAVDNEEPSLLEWLSTDLDLSRLFFANRSTIYWLIVSDSQKGIPLGTTVQKIDALTSRLLAATSWRALMLARAEHREGLADS